MFEETHPLPECGERPLKVFISSVVSEFKEERQMLVDLICDLEMTPVHSEDPPHVGEEESPGHACLRMVDEADICIFLFGEKYGYEGTESGKSPTEEEFDRAMDSAKTSRFFIKEVPERHPSMQQLVEKVSDYDTGRWCYFFGDIDELARKAYEQLLTIRNNWDFRNETKDGWLFITQMVEYYSDRDISHELRLNGKNMLLKILNIDELPSIPNVEIEDLTLREDPRFDIERLERFRRKGQMSQLEFDQKSARAIERACALNMSSHCLLKIDELLQRYTGRRISGEDLNGPISKWIRECFGRNERT